MLQAIGSSRFALYHHIVRRRIEVALAADHRDDFSRQLDAAWRERLADQAALRQRAVPDPDPPPAPGQGRRLDRIRAAARPRARRPTRQPPTPTSSTSSNQARDALIAALGNYEPRLLGVYETPQGPCSEPLEFLSYALQWRDAAGAAADAGSRRLSALSADQLRPGDGRARAGRRQPPRLPRPGLDQGLSGPDRARDARRVAAPAVRADRLAKLRLRRAAGGACRG